MSRPDPDGSPPTSVESLQAVSNLLRQNVAELARNGPTLAQRVGGVKAAHTSPDQLVSVEVDAMGRLAAISFDAGIYRRPDAGALGRAVMEAVRQAQASAEAQVADVFGELVPRQMIKPQMAGDAEAAQRAMHEHYLPRERP
ncbi:YbaB/EbfC family nucleoid-associated protein [Blastococcus sp. Marseille-P5729]|uniref:YbaB/EbfC family nucleoid-associated protein n=1 Tax=Blastococcus sp. Marseille-P5729 TaxID=2086582 RepID=UPI00131D26C2|nr:YbaB/EbfC family nucleoid-associated protein [Blastococcus sp. Marseille-P5729]